MEKIPSVLVVDDDDLLCEMLQDLFSGSGWTVVTARSITEAVEALEENPIDVVLTDLNLSAGSGYEILERLAGRAPRPVAILMSALMSDEIVEHARELGASSTLRKPFHNSDVLEAAQRALRSSSVAAVAHAG